MRHDGKEAQVEAKKLKEAPGLCGRPRDEVQKFRPGGATAEPEVPASRAATRMARAKATSKTPTGKGFMQATIEAKPAKEELRKQPKAAPQVPQAPQAEEEAVQVVDRAESEEDRQFRERYLSAEKETEPEWKMFLSGSAKRGFYCSNLPA